MVTYSDPVCPAMVNVEVVGMSLVIVFSEQVVVPYNTQRLKCANCAETSSTDGSMFCTQCLVPCVSKLTHGATKYTITGHFPLKKSCLLPWLPTNFVIIYTSTL